MSCPRCGSGAPPLHGRCAQCGASLVSDSAPTAIGLATPLPLPNSDNVTQFGPVAGATSTPPPTTAPPTSDQTVAMHATMQQRLGRPAAQTFRGGQDHLAPG